MAPLSTPRDAALALLNHHHRNLNRRCGQFLGQIAVEDFDLSDKQADWLGKLLERAGLPPLTAGGAHE